MPDYNINLTIQNIWNIFRIVLDIGIMWFVLCYAIKFVRNNSRTIQIFKGIIAILVVNGIARLLGLTTVTYFSDMIISWGFLAAIIIFQPEIRGLLERIGKSNTFSRINTLLANEKEELVNQLYEATIALSKEGIGALISIEQSQSLQDYISQGVPVNATVTKQLLCSIFMTTTPLHDGAVIIQGDKIACASAYLPPTSINLSSRYGARHRAALGIAEVSDALTIVVSEETSAISIAEKSRIFSVDEKQLKDYLRRVICNDDIEIRKQSKQRNSLLISDSPDMVIEKEEESSGFFAGLFKKEEKTENSENVETGSDMKNPVNNRRKQLKKANASDNESVEEVIEIKDNTETEPAAEAETEAETVTVEENNDKEEE